MVITIAKNNPLFKKVGSDLTVLEIEYEAAITNSGGAFFQPSNSLLQVENGFIVIDAIANGNTEALKADLEKLGLKNVSTYGLFVSGFLPITQIDEIAKLSTLDFARPAYRPILNVGSVNSQGDPAMRSDIVRQNFGFDGTGEKIGVLSDSYNKLNGANADIASGDLPGSGNTLGNTTPIQVLNELDGSGSDEGRAMLQLIHDVAPKASLAFHTASEGEASFASGIVALANAGAKVIVDDVFYYAEPMFQDGIIAQAVDRVVNNNGVAYFSSAGNSGRRSYESAFRDSGIAGPFGNDVFHDFDPGAGVDIFQSITIPLGATAIFDLQWDQPFKSVTGTVGSANDIDILIYDSAGTAILASAANNNTGQDPFEFLAFTNNTGSTQFNLAISKYGGGSNPGKLKYIRFGNVTVNEFDTKSSTVVGHANAQGAEAVGAADYRSTPAFGTSPPQIEFFSSAGSTPILFTTSGAATNQIRPKPGIVAPDGTDTTFFGSDSDGNGRPNFFGTSAAAPHAAAVAALLRDADPTLTPSAIYQALENSAIDMDDSLTPGFDTGFDNLTGRGLIQADRALASVLGVPSCNGKIATIFVNASNRIIGGSSNGQTYAGILLGTGGDDVIVTNNGNDFVTGLGGNDTICVKDGNNTVSATGATSYIEAGSGNDTIGIGSGTDVVLAGDGNNYIYSLGTGASDRNTITTGSGSDTILMLLGTNDVVTGLGNDQITLGAGNDLINAGAGDNNVTTGGGQDKIVLVEGIGITSIQDFQDSSDKLTGFSFSTVTVTQGTGADLFNTIITKTAGGDVLAKLVNVSASLINASDFV
jgi:Ca2+-binding RTX toxin-like protein